MIFVGFQSGLMHEAADSEVSHQKPVEPLTHLIGSLAA